jgi:hypothetical protein
MNPISFDELHARLEERQRYYERGFAAYSTSALEGRHESGVHTVGFCAHLHLQVNDLENIAIITDVKIHIIREWEVNHFESSKIILSFKSKKFTKGCCNGCGDACNDWKHSKESIMTPIDTVAKIKEAIESVFNPTSISMSPDNDHKARVGV